MRLIDADALWKEIITAFDDGLDLADLREHMDAQPTIEAVEVVFCGDCIHHKDSPVLGTYCEVHDWCSKDEDYCSFAERRDDETD